MECLQNNVKLFIAVVHKCVPVLQGIILSTYHGTVHPVVNSHVNLKGFNIAGHRSEKKLVSKMPIT